MQFSGGSGYCISAVSLGTRCINHGPPNLLVLVFEYKCVSLVLRCHGSVSHELLFGLISHINAEPRYHCKSRSTASRACFNIFLYCFPCFRVQFAGVMLYHFSVSYSCFESVTQFSYSAFYQASVTSSLIFQFTFFAGPSAHRLWMDSNEVYFGLCWTMWHCDTSFLLYTVFPCHCLYTNAW